MTGRVVQDGAPVGAGIVIELEDHDTVTTTTDAEGYYAFNAVSLDGNFSVTFAQEWNAQLSAGSVASWAWLDGFAPSGDLTFELPDLEISLEVESQRFAQMAPADGASFSAGQLSCQNPIRFEWTPYPDAMHYWVDLGVEGEDTPVWQSSLLFPTSYSFCGTLSDGSSIEAGAYWWNIGVQKEAGSVYRLTAYGHPWSLIIDP